MRFAILLGVLLVPQETAKELKAACDKMDKAKSYHFTLKVLQEGKDKSAVEGEYFAPGILHIRSDKGETVKTEDKKYAKKGEEWSEAPERPRLEKLAQRQEELARPHDWVRRIAEQCETVRREKSSK
jgi:hypothetical protein